MHTLFITRITFFPFFLLPFLWIGCQTTFLSKKSFDSPAYRPQNRDAVRVKVSLNHQMIYVLEGNKPLLVTPTCVGTPDRPTPQGHFTIYKKIEKKRSNSYGYFIKEGRITNGKRTQLPPGHQYVGYPMPYWVEFKPAYGFHSGWVWPVPRTYGCLRIHQNVAPKFFALVKKGTPVHIAPTQPEDKTLGRNINRPQDYRDPDPPAPKMISPAIFTEPKKPLFVD